MNGIRQRVRYITIVGILVLLLVGWTSQKNHITQFPTHTVFDYQLSGVYPPAPGVGGVVRDSSDLPVHGMFSICYVNGFQSQPGERNVWLNKHKALLLVDAKGKPISDPSWPDEFLLDTSTAERRNRIAVIINRTINICAKKGFKAVEIDNLDSYTRSSGRLTQNGALALARLYAIHAHAAGLAIAQKNSGDLGMHGRDQVGFDFAVSEECQRFDECSSYSNVYGWKFIDIEYTDDLRGTIAQLCADPQIPFSTIIRDRNLTRPGNKTYFFQRCH
jgi:hypothetical protein